jgi:hypothetical protein
VGFAWIHFVWGLALLSRISIESCIAPLTSLAEVFYDLGLVIVVAVAARVGVSMKYLLVAGAVTGVGLFYKFLHHDIHIASGIGFGLSHIDHIAIGVSMLSSITIAVGSILILQKNDKNAYLPITSLCP